MNMVATFTGVQEGIILRKRGGREMREEERDSMGGGGLCFPQFNRAKGAGKGHTICGTESTESEQHGSDKPRKQNKFLAHLTERDET